MLKQAGFLGTGATFGADLTLIVEIIFFLALCVGVVAQRRRRYRLHDWIQTPVVVLNLFFIIFIMIASFLEQRVPGTLPERPGDPYYLVVGIHAVLGLVAEGLGIYCLLAGHQILPRKIGRLRYWMWTTFGFWALAVLFGVGTYYVWYVREAPAAEVEVTAVDTGQQEEVDETTAVSNAPSSQRVLLQNFEFAPLELTVVAGTTVTWLNQDGAPHNITFADGSVASDNFFQGESFEAAFDEPGTYTIYCSLHGNADGSGMATVVTVLEATDENISDVAAAATAAPTPVPVPPTPTPAPTVAPPPVDPIEPAAPDQDVVGLVAFFDTTAPSDSLNVVLQGLETPPSGAELHAWLSDSRSGQVLDLGAIEPDGSGNVSLQYTDEQHQNLLGLYDGFQVTQEPQFDDNPAPGTVIYSGRQPAEALAAIRTITVRAAETPNGQAYAFGARLQTEELLRHVEFVQTAFDLLSIADAQRHSEHIINLLEGEQGEFFGDLDGKHGVQNPGDGFGIIPYVTAIQEAAVAADEASDTTKAIQLHAGHVLLATDNALTWATAVREAALQIEAAESVGDIGEQVATLNRFGQLLLNGEDSNGDGEIAPGEGGIFTAYQHAQYMAAIGVSTGDAGAVVDSSKIVSPDVAEQVVDGELVVNMVDFSFSPAVATVPAGTTVRFVNVGQARHSATADDGSFDSTLLAPGEEFTITFSDPGTYNFYCVLHGLPGGEGMAGTITVEGN